MLKDTQPANQPVVEYVRYELGPDATGQFEAAYQAVGRLLTASPHCLSWELARGMEHPGSFVVRIEWDSLAGHEQGFRGSPGFAEFFQTLAVFSAQRLEMAHYRAVNGSAGAA